MGCGRVTGACPASVKHAGCVGAESAAPQPHKAARRRPVGVDGARRGRSPACAAVSVPGGKLISRDFGGAVGCLNDDAWLGKLLSHKRLLATGQVSLVRERKEQQRHLLLRQGVGQARHAKSGLLGRQLDAVDLIASFHFELPGKKGETLTEELIMRAVAEEFLT